MGTKVIEYVEGSLFISGGEQGISERYCLGAVSLAAAKADMLIIANWRAAIMSGGFKLKWCQVHNTDAARLAKAVITAPLPNLYDGDETDGDDRGFGTVNETRDSLHLRFETAEGAWANRFISGVSDLEITDDEAANAWPAATDPLPATVPAVTATTGPTYMQYIRNFAEHVRLKTFIPVALKNDPDGFKYELFAIESVILRGVTTRKRGRPFGQSRGRTPTRIV